MLGATFKAILIKCIYMTEELQTKCKQCFGGPRLALYGC